MPVIKSEFFLALNQVASERGISPEEVIESIKRAVLAAYRKDYGVELPEDQEDEEIDDNLEVKLNDESGEMHILEDGKDITPPGFGRIAAQTARQVILQQIREAEKRHIVQHYTDQVGTLVKGRVIRFDPRYVSFDIGKAEAVLPQDEQIRSEHYRVNDTMILYIKEINEDKFGNSRIIISRSDPRLVEELFAKEVPEIAAETVKIFKVVRAPGERSKIAVFTDQSGVDPVGACVGQKGIRVKAVTDELGGSEKIDIIQYLEDDILFIREALSPATVKDIQINGDEKKATVFVTEEQAPLAIGKGGVNVNLAANLTGFEIDIEQVESDDEDSEDTKDTQDENEAVQSPEKEAVSEPTDADETVEETVEESAEAPQEETNEEKVEAES